MSWNSTFVVINRDFSNQIDKLQTDLNLNLGQQLKTISWEEATSSGTSGKSLGFCKDWTIISDPFMFLDTDEPTNYDPSKIWLPKFEKGLETFSMNSKALGFILGGSSSTYGMTIHKNGELLRCRLIQEGEIIIDFGDSLPEEIETFENETDEEQRVFVLMSKFGLSSTDLEKTSFTLYESSI